MASAFAQPTEFEQGAMQAAGPTEGEVRDKLTSLVQELQRLADDQVQRKRETEDRWLEDLRAFHGRYDETTESELKDANKSRAFIKITRKKTNSWEARLSALLFPTDDENWDIRPTPVPTLHEAAKAAMAQAEQMVEQANQQQDPAAAQQMAMGAQQKLDEAARLTAEMAEARKRGEAMRQEMKDQLVECDYASENRLVIRDCVRIGTGILKGPLAGDRQRGKWVQLEGDMYVYERESDPAPVYKWVDPWNYFPDMSAIRPADREFEFERHLWSAKDLRKLVRERGFNPAAVRELLQDRPSNRAVTEPSMHYLTQLRAITGNNDTIKDRFVGWEYHGPLECQQIALVLRALGQDEAAKEYEEENDPLKEIRVICFFCEGKMLKMSPAYPLDSGDSLYSIFTFEPGEASLFGYGVPAIMGDSQKSLNGSWRMALDNAALSVGPQVFLDRDAIEPADRKWTITPRKLWFKKKGSTLGNGPVMEVSNVPNNVEEIMMIVDLSRRFIDDETALPVQAEGEMTDNPNITATATNYMSLASNITFRRVVKNFDDGITAPSIRRLYDWNMQHNSREDIKGDMKVDARGSTALLQRELQAQMLLNISQNWTTHPHLKHALKAQGWDAIVDTLRGSMIQPETILATREEFEASLAAEAEAQAAAAEGANESNPTVVAANIRMQAAQIDADSRLQVANMQRETELMQTAQHYNIQVEKLRTMLGMKEMDIASSERKFAAEVAVEEERAREAAARGEKPAGSGGYINSGGGAPA